MRSCLVIAAVLFVGFAAAEDKGTKKATVSQEHQTQEMEGSLGSVCQENPSLSICTLYDALANAMVELDNFYQDLDQDRSGKAEKRKSPFMRFGKRKSPFMRFGKRKSPFMRFGRSGPAESEEGQDLGMEKRKSTYLRFG